jgi:hypothetical protein
MNGVVNSDMYFTKKKEVRAMVTFERLLLPSFTYVNIYIQPMWFNFIHLQGHVIPKCVYNIKEANGYMTKIPLLWLKNEQWKQECLVFFTFIN